MVFLGLGIVLISLSVLAYKYGYAYPRKLQPPCISLNDDGSDPDSKPRSIHAGGEEEKSHDDPESLRDAHEADTAVDFTFAPAKASSPKGKQPTDTKKMALSSTEEQPRIAYPPVQPEKETLKSPPPLASPILNGKPIPKPPTTSLMPPPLGLPTKSTPRAPPRPSGPLRPPPSAATSLRAPPSGSLAPSPFSLAPSTSTLAPSSRSSKKVLLDIGHSPLDWAHLTTNPPTPTYLRGEDVPPNLIRVPPSLLRSHTGRKGKTAWGVYRGKVYNLSPYMKFHPGGVGELMRGAGKETEGERLFNEIHPWVSWENMLGECLIGILVSENEAQAGKEDWGALEEMD